MRIMSAYRNELLYRAREYLAVFTAVIVGDQSRVFGVADFNTIIFPRDAILFEVL